LSCCVAALEIILYIEELPGRGFELEASLGIKYSVTNRETAPEHPLAWRCGEELLNVQLFGAALRLPQIIGKLHLQPMLRRTSERLG